MQLTHVIKALIDIYNQYGDMDCYGYSHKDGYNNIVDKPELFRTSQEEFGMIFYGEGSIEEIISDAVKSEDSTKIDDVVDKVARLQKACVIFNYKKSD